MVQFTRVFRRQGQTEPKAQTIPGLFSLLKPYIFLNVSAHYRIIFYVTYNRKHFNYMCQLFKYNKQPHIQWLIKNK